ncbi:MAG: hypothetical protein D6705_11115, partial [Deltaproteobacteria bacterium]
MRRARLALVLVALSLAGVLAAVARPATARKALARTTGVALQEVAEAAGLDVLAEPLAVTPHVPSSAPAWTREAVLEAVTDADAMRAEPSADAAVLVEPVGTPAAFAVRASLWRRGWAVASPEPVVGHAMP